MTIQPITSFTDTETIYSLTINKEGWAIDCSCPSQYYARKRGEMSHKCKHMNFYNQQKGLADAAAAQAQAEQETRRHASLNGGNKGFSLL